MLKAIVTNKKSIRVVTKGNLGDITVETLAVIKEIYKGVKGQNEAAAKEFRRNVVAGLLDPNSPVWRES